LKVTHIKCILSYGNEFRIYETIIRILCADKIIESQDLYAVTFSTL